MKYVRWNIEKARQYFAERGCELLEAEYKNYSTPMRYRATCGHEHTITMNNFLRGKGDLCKACRYKLIAEKEGRVSEDDIRAALAEECCELISVDTPGWAKKFRYLAQCGHENETTYGKWMDGGGRLCASCSKSIRYTKEYVESVFKLYGCELVGEYTNCKTPVEYIDPYGKRRYTTFDLFLNGRNKRDRDAGLPPWRMFVFSRDDYTCQVCGERGGDLEAHHLKNYADNVADRMEPENGVTLCKKCHREFHKAMGFRNNTAEQYETWKREYRGKYEPNNS